MNKMTEKAMRKTEGGASWYCPQCRKFGKYYTFIGWLAVKAGHGSHNSGGGVVFY